MLRLDDQHKEPMVKDHLDGQLIDVFFVQSKNDNFLIELETKFMNLAI